MVNLHTKLAMLLTTVGDDAVKDFEAFTYDEGESAERFDVVVRKFREYCTPVRNRLRAFLVLATRPDARRKYRPVRYAPAPSGEILQLPCRGQGVERLDAAVGYRGHGV